MIDPVTRAAPALPPSRASAESPAPAPAAPAPATGPAPVRSEASAPERTPLSMDVAKARDGVFVYTLSDPSTGTVLAVIPRRDVEDRGGRTVDTRA